jgi:hypothetical protein
VETFHEGGAWRNGVEGSAKVLSNEEAQAAGRRYAMEHQVGHIVRNFQGQIGERITYGHDPGILHG